MLLSSFSFIQSSQTSIVALVQPPSLVVMKMMMVMIENKWCNESSLMIPLMI